MSIVFLHLERGLRTPRLRCFFSSRFGTPFCLPGQPPVEVGCRPPPVPDQCRHAPPSGRASPRRSRRVVPAYSLPSTLRRRKLHAGLHRVAPLAVLGLEPGTKRSWMDHSDETGDATCQWTGLEFRRRGAEGRQRKTPIAYADGGCVEKPYLTLLGSRRSSRNNSRGRSPDLRIILLANAFPTVVPPVATSVGVRPRSQWRVREGIAPSSQHAPSRAAIATINN